MKYTRIYKFIVTFARKDNSLRINRLVGLLENWVTRWQPFVFLSSSLLCHNVITLDATKVQKESPMKENNHHFLSSATII